MSRSKFDFNLISYNSVFLGISIVPQSMTPLIIPLLVQEFVGIENQGHYYGNIRLWTLMLALITQAIVGTVSDHTNSRIGKRKPYIFLGSLLSILFVVTIGYTQVLSGMNVHTMPKRFYVVKKKRNWYQNVSRNTTLSVSS